MKDIEMLTYTAQPQQEKLTNMKDLKILCSCLNQTNKKKTNPTKPNYIQPNEPNFIQPNEQILIQPCGD